MDANSTSARKAASTLVLTLGCLAVLAISAAYALDRVRPRYQAAAQFAAWQEARIAAEAGVDVALSEVKLNATANAGGNWSGWQQSGTGLVSAAGSLISLKGGQGAIGKALVAAGLAVKRPGAGFGAIANALSGTLSQANSILSISGNPVTISAPIYLDNLQVVLPGNRPTNVDVQLWAVYPTASPYCRWFCIRAVATCAIPSVASATLGDRLDNILRRYSLRQIRPQLAREDVGTPMKLPTPNTSRIVEVLVEPILPFELAILTDDTLSLGTSGTWNVDSYDSRDPKKSAPGGVYPGRGSAQAQSNASIGSNAHRMPDSLYGPLINANACVVSGTVATNGGDDPSTPAHENVQGATGIDSARIRSDFHREMQVMARPDSGIFLAPPLAGQPFVAGTVSQPSLYLVPGNLQGFSVIPSSNTEPGALTIMINGDLSVPTGTIAIPAGISATLYVRGNIDFFDRPINQGGLPQALQIYGEDSAGAPRTLSAFGNASVSAAFYGPQYQVKLMDNVTWYGAVAARSFEMIGGGTGGFHYDEALNVVGAPIGFRVARYIEDVRE